MTLEEANEKLERDADLYKSYKYSLDFFNREIEKLKVKMDSLEQMKYHLTSQHDKSTY